MRAAINHALLDDVQVAYPRLRVPGQAKFIEQRLALGVEFFVVDGPEQTVGVGRVVAEDVFGDRHRSKYRRILRKESDLFFCSWSERN